MKKLAATRPAPVLPKWLWLWFPPLLLFVIIPIRIIDPAAYSTWIDSELGLIELTTPVLAFIGAVIGCRLLLRLRHDDFTTINAWIALLVLVCIYFAGEELSWGQHIFQWQTPEYIESINDQKETNLHNVSSWFDQKPRLLLELWVLIGGVFVPLRELQRGSRLTPSEFRYWFWPTMDCLPAAGLAILVRLPERLKDLCGIESMPLEIRYSEPQEYYFAMFLMIYLASLTARRGRQAS
ncbi:MAG: hypothetical protein VX929_14635 [Pseudomonadota bacterium]|nr:hypothetical protein [Pseudomonadota bacterium]